MNSKIRYIPLVVIGAILLSLMAIAPAFSATEGDVLIVPTTVTGTGATDPDDALEWARQGSFDDTEAPTVSVQIEVVDDDLNVAIDREQTHNITTDGSVEVILTATPLAGLDSIEVVVPQAVLDNGVDVVADRVVSARTGRVDLFVSGMTAGGQTAFDVNIKYGQAGINYSQSPVMEDTNVADDPDTDADESTQRKAGDPNENLGEVACADGSTSSRQVPDPDNPGSTKAEDLPNICTNLVSVESNNDEIEVVLDETGVNTGVFRATVTLVPPGTKATVATARAEATAARAAHQAALDANTQTAGSVPADRVAELDTAAGDAETEATRLEGLLVDNSLEVAENNDEVLARYADEDPADTVTDTIGIESTSPVMANHNPSHATVAETPRPDFEVEITDTESGVVERSITLVVSRVVNNKSTGVARDNRTSTNDIDNGFEASEDIESSFANVGDDDVSFYWWYVAKDVAGNIGVSDRATTDADGDPNPCNPDLFNTALTGGVLRSELNNVVDDPESDDEDDLLSKGDGSEAFGCQGFKYTADVEDPELVSLRTGAWWDTDIEDDDKTNVDPNDADSESIMLVFSEPLDSASVEASDFLVDGDTPIAADVFSGNSAHVFLTVPELDPDAEPEVEFAEGGEVADVAGRTTDTGMIEPNDRTNVDGIAPTLEVTLEGKASMEDGRPATNERVTISVTANERIQTPRYTYWRIDNVSTSGGYSPTRGTGDVIPFESGRTYEVDVKLPGQGLYSILVTAADASNPASVAKVGVDHKPVSDDPDTEDVVEMRTPFEDVSGALLIEVDVDVAGGSDGLVLDPSKSAGDDDANMFESDDPNLFISIDLSAEGSEYPIDDGTPEAGEDQATSDQDTYNAVTIVSATLDGDDITSMLVPNTANNVFLYKASGLELGEHKVEVEATDAVGNEREFSGTVTIVERKPYSLGLTPGWNLVSIPGTPEDSDINAVIPADHDISRVHSYDPTVPGFWLTAIRGADGSFSGTLTNITSDRAYLIETSTAAPLSINIPRLDVLTLPPVIAISEGYNMVPVLDPSGSAEDGTVAASEYLEGAKVVRIYGYSAIHGSLVAVDPEEGMLNVGAGYWVYASEAGAITP